MLFSDPEDEEEAEANSNMAGSPRSHGRVVTMPWPRGTHGFLLGDRRRVRTALRSQEGNIGPGSEGTF